VLIDTTQLALQQAMAGASQRQTALAANLANAETPGYQRVDVDFHGALQAALGSGDATQKRNSLQALAFSPQADGSVGATRADGSSLDVDAESAKLAANALEYQAAVQVAHARIDILRTAIGVK
jgi:flagellar basal-body rod protein FlgB